MANEAKGLLAESDRLMKEAFQLAGITPEAPKKTRAKKEAPVVVEQPVVTTKAGRPRKAKVAG
jgi:hypothetical protein